MKLFLQPIRLSLVFLLLAASANAQSPILDITFGDDASTSHLESTVDGVAVGKLDNQTSGLIIDGKVKSQSLKAVAVESLKKYKLTVRAAIDSADSVEVNDRIPELSSITFIRNFAGCDLHFFNKEGEEISFVINGRDRVHKTLKNETSIDIVSEKFHDYITVFYAPPGAETVHLDFAPRNRKLMIESIVLEQENSEGTVNCNPDFRYGELNLSGWKPDTEGRLFRRPDDTTVLKCGTGASSSLFVVDDEMRYSFFCKGVGYDKKSGKVIVLFFDKNGDDLGHTHLFWDKDMQEGATKSEIKPPPGAKLAMIKASLVILEHVNVTQDQ